MRSCLFHFGDSRKDSVPRVPGHGLQVREAHREVPPELLLRYVVTSCEVHIREALYKWLFIPGELSKSALWYFNLRIPSSIHLSQVS
jgi:hypothetical protein